METSDRIRPTYFTDVEGGEWCKWLHGSIDRSILDLRDASNIIIDFVGFRVAIHSFRFEDGREWDCVNGWRTYIPTVEGRWGDVPKTVRDLALNRLATFNISTQQLPKWDARMLALAEHISAWSKDPSTKCGAVIADGKFVVSIGYNGLPSGIDDNDSRLQDRTIKYRMTIHAEENALLRSNRSVEGCTIYTYPFPPCSNCAGKIAQVGIKRVIAPAPTSDLAKRWETELELARQIYSEAGIELVEVEDGKKA